MFKNARLYRLADATALDQDVLEGRLAERRFRPCGPLETVTLGWAPALGDRTRALAHAANGCLLMCARRQERLLPSAVLAEMLDERIAEIEEREARDVGRKERRQLRESVLVEMLPRAFTRSRRVLSFIDLQTGWLLVDAGNEKAAEESVGLLRETLGSLRAYPVQAEQPAEVLMTRWVADGAAPEGLELGDECELRDRRDEHSVVRCRGQDLSGEEIATHLRAGKEVVKLALDWRERLAFVLQEDLALRRLRFADALIQEAVAPELDDEVARTDAEFVIMTHELRGLLEGLSSVFGLTGSSEQDGQ